MALSSRTSRRIQVLSLATAAVLGAGGCYLVSPDITDFMFMLPEKTFTVDSARWNLPMMGTLPVVPCSSDMDCAAVDPMNPSAFTCQPVGSGGAKECAATVQISLVAPVNLQQEDMSFVSTVKSNPVVSASIQSITYTVAKGNDTLSFDTPPIDLYVAPATVMDPASPMATKFATIPTLPIGFSGTGSVSFAQGGQDALDPYIKDYSQTFNIIAAGTMTFKGGDPVPTGQLTLAVDSAANVSCSGCK